MCVGENQWQYPSYRIVRCIVSTPLTMTAKGTASSTNAPGNNTSTKASPNPDDNTKTHTTITISAIPADAQARGWMEVSLVDNVKTEELSLGRRLLHGHSVVMLAPKDTFVTETERTTLIQASLAQADATEPTEFETAGRRRLPSVDAANRAAAFGTPCGMALDDATDDLLQTIYQRVVQYLDQTWPAAVQVLFGVDDDNDSTTVSLTNLMKTDQLQYASREPAINVYRQGGAFAPHQDDQSLTALICLSCPDVDFKGGGTAFWAPRNGAATPRVVLRPPAGTVLLFGGTVTHAAQAVTAGCRVMAVSSFSPRDPDDKPTFLY